MNFKLVSSILLVLVAKINGGQHYRIDGRTYYSSYPDTRNWYQAKRFCTYMGLHLVDVRTDEENKRILSVINQTNTENNITAVNYWTSGTDLGNENSFYWDTTGHSFIYWYWALNQPDNAKGLAAEHCVHYSGGHNYKWNDSACEHVWYFICRDVFDIPIYKTCI